MKSSTRLISRKLISVIVAAMFFMAAAIAIVIGVSGYDNLESITRNNISRAVNVIAKEVEAITDRSDKVLQILGQNTEAKDLLVLLSTLGPYYFEEGLQDSEIEAADQIYSLQSQLELASILKPVIKTQKMDSITFYHLDAFNKSRPSSPAFSFRLRSDGLDIAQFASKSRDSWVASSMIDTSYLAFLNLFDVSSIYELTLGDFLTNIDAQRTLATPEAPFVDNKATYDRLLLINGDLVIQSAALMELAVSNPITWGGEVVDMYAVVLEQIVDKESIERLKTLVNVDIALLVDGDVIVSTLSDTQAYSQGLNGRVKNGELEYFSSSRKIAFTAGSDDLRELEVVALSPVAEVVELNFQLFIQVFMVIIACTLLITVLYYFVIARIINKPLSALMQGVEEMAQGEMQHVIKVDSQDEMGLLAAAFNNMSADVHKKNEQLKESHAELEILLEKQSKELESTQNQLIESEKMSSLGELVAGVSHEVSTPIGICITAESFFRDEAKRIQSKFNEGSMARQDFTEFMTIAMDNSEILSANLTRTAELIKNFKQVAVDQCIEDFRTFAVHAYILDLLSTLRPRIKSLKHVIEVTGDEKLVITSLPGALAQIITNLIMNSIIHGFDEIEKGCIRIQIERKNKGAFLVYTDDGKGMSDEALEKVFDPFFTTRKGKGGTGLGMNIVYKLITDTLKGSIQCSSELGQGVRFEIFIADQEI